MATTQQLQAALQAAQAAGNSSDVAQLQSALSQAQTQPQAPSAVAATQQPPSQYGQQQLSDAIYAASDAGDQQAAHQLFTQLRSQGMNLAPRSPAAQQAAFQKLNAQNVAAQPWYETALQGVGEGSSNFWQGVKENTYDRVADLIDGGNRIAQDQGSVAEQRNLSQALNSTAAGKIGNFAGGAMSAAPLMLIPGGGETMMARVGLGALAGGAGGYLMPSASNGEEVANTLGGVALGGALPATIPMVRGAVSPLVQYGQRFTNPGAVADRVVARRLAGNFGLMNPTDAQAGTAQNVLLAGSGSPFGKTAAEAMGSEQAVQAERAARNSQQGGTVMTAVDNARNAQRLNALQQQAGADTVGMTIPTAGQPSTPIDALDAAIATRAANASNFRTNNLDVLTPYQRWGDGLNTLAGINPGRASDADALDAVRQIFRNVRNGSMQEDEASEAINELRDPIRSQKAQTAIDNALGATQTRQVDPQPVLDTINQLRMGDGAGAIAPTLNGLRNELTNLQDTNGLVPASALDAIRRDLGAKLDTYQPLPIPRTGDSRILALNPVKDALTDTLTNAIPGYQQYLSNYAEQSVPVNTGRIIRNLLDNVSTRARNAAQDPILTKNDVQQTINAVDKSPYGISPQAQQTLNDVQQSLLSRSATNQAMGSAGSQTGANIGNRLMQQAIRSGTGAAIGGIGGSSFGPVGSVLGALAGMGIEGLNHLGNSAVERAVAQRLADSNMAGQSFVNLLSGRQARNAFDATALPWAARGGLLLQNYFRGMPSVTPQGAVSPEQPPWMMNRYPQALSVQ